MFLARKSIARLSDRLTTVERQLDELAKDRNAHVLELDEMYEKLNRLYGRIKKRQERSPQVAEQPELDEVPCADPVSARVHAFREAKSHVLS